MRELGAISEAHSSRTASDSSPSAWKLGLFLPALARPPGVTLNQDEPAFATPAFGCPTKADTHARPRSDGHGASAQPYGAEGHDRQRNRREPRTRGVWRRRRGVDSGRNPGA